MTWLLVWACTGAPSTPSETPRTPAAACARLEALDVRCTGCEGGSLGDEVSLACQGTWRGKALTLDAVTTGAPLPPSPGAAGAMVEDLWVEVKVGQGSPADLPVAQDLLRRYGGLPEAP